jgi:hypothetical protein
MGKKKKKKKDKNETLKCKKWRLFFSFLVMNKKEGVVSLFIFKVYNINNYYAA